MDDEDFIPEDSIGPEPEQKPFLDRVALFAVNHVFSLMIFVLVLVLGLILWLSRGTPPTTLTQFNEIRTGITEKQVEEILGFAANSQPHYVRSFPGDKDAVWKAWDDGQTIIII